MAHVHVIVFKPFLYLIYCATIGFTQCNKLESLETGE